MRDFERRDFSEMLKTLVEAKAAPIGAAAAPAAAPDEFTNNWKPSGKDASEKDIAGAESSLDNMLNVFEEKWNTMKSTMTKKMGTIMADLSTFRKLASPTLSSPRDVTDADAQAELDKELGTVDTAKIGAAKQRKGKVSDIGPRVAKSLSYDDTLGTSGADLSGRTASTAQNADIDQNTLDQANKPLNLRTKAAMGRTGELRDRTRPSN